MSLFPSQDGPIDINYLDIKRTFEANLPVVNLFEELVDCKKVECLNENPTHPFPRLDGTSQTSLGQQWVESDCDEQLLISLGFHLKVKLVSISFLGVSDDTPAAPKVVKLFKDRPNMDFEDCSSPDQIIQLSKMDVEIGQRITFKPSTFSVGSSFLSIFIESNQGKREITKLKKMELHGAIIPGRTILPGSLRNISEHQRQQILR